MVELVGTWQSWWPGEVWYSGAGGERQPHGTCYLEAGPALHQPGEDGELLGQGQASRLILSPPIQFLVCVVNRMLLGLGSLQYLQFAKALLSLFMIIIVVG